MRDVWCAYIWDCASSTSPHAVPEISAMPLVLAICVLIVTLAILIDRSPK